MSKGLFAVVLVAASFAGGAMVNGPGLRWAQAMLLNRPVAGEDVASVSQEDLVPPPTGDPPPAGSIPSVPVPPLPPAPTGPTPAQEKSGGIENRPTSGVTKALAPAPEPKAPAVPEPKAPTSPDPDGSGRTGGELDRAQPSPGKEAAPAPAGPADPLPPLELPAPKDREATGRDQPEGDLPGPAPSAAVPPRASRPPTGPGEVPGSRTPGDWAEIRRALGALGVARYGIEGEPGGRVRFHCLIPIAGRHAVGQQFEAEGDDEFQAAQLALRRVALWRAAEVPAP